MWAVVGNHGAMCALARRFHTLIELAVGGGCASPDIIPGLTHDAAIPDEPPAADKPKRVSRALPHTENPRTERRRTHAGQAKTPLGGCRRTHGCTELILPRTTSEVLTAAEISKPAEAVDPPRMIVKTY